MSSSYAGDGRRQSARALLGNAVHRAPAKTVDGLLERVFTFAFSGLVYPQIWEDPVVDMEAMQIKPHHHIVTIASGGCNVLSYLVADPAKITAVDLNHAHVALLKLKLAGLRHLPGWESFYQFFGDADWKTNVQAYKAHLRDQLDPEARRYWESRTLLGRRRITHFTTNIYRKGLLGRFISMSHFLAKAYGHDMEQLLESRSIQQQRRFFDTAIAPLFERKFVRWVTDRKVSLYGLGIPPAQYDALCEGQPMSQVLRARLEKLTCGFPLRENYFAWQAFGRRYGPGGSGPLPPYLQARNFANLRLRAGRVDVQHASYADAVSRMAPGSADRFVLLDSQDWMTDAQLRELWTAISHAAASGARVIFRTAARETTLAARLPPHILAQWRYLADLSTDLGRRDRSSVYGGFHVFERAKEN